MFRGGATATGFAAITGGSITGTNVPYVLSQSAIPFIHMSSATMGNNGALSSATIMPRTYTGGAWIYLPASAISAGSTAGWYWFIGSSTTAGTVFNSTYTSGPPTLGTQTAFATTGPGAFTSDTSEHAGPTITVPANALGANGSLQIYDFTQFTNSAGTKTPMVRYSGAGGTQYQNVALTTQATARGYVEIANAGATNSQIGQAWQELGNSGVTQNGFSSSTADTTTATSVVISLAKNTATDILVVENYRIEVRFAA